MPRRSFPCLHCNRAVRNNQNAILCVNCNKWSHLKCTDVPDKLFNSNEDWICDLCLWKFLPSNECLLNDVSENDHCNEIGDHVPECVTSSFSPQSPPITSHDISHMKGLKIAHLNCLSLLKHIDEIRLRIKSLDLDILALSETHLCPDIDDKELNIPAYILIRRDRNRFGGGVAIYVKDSLTHVVRTDIIGDLIIESITIELKLTKQKPLLVTVWYRPPNSSLDTFRAFECMMQRLDQSYNDFVVIGDLNCDVLNQRRSWQTKKLFDIMETYNCTQLISRPTRVTKTSSTAVDLILTNAPSKFASSGVYELSMTDHFMIYCVLSRCKTSENSQEHKYKFVRSYKNFDEGKFIRDIENICWEPIHTATDIVTTYEKFISLLNAVIDRHAPMRKVRVKQKESPWMTSEILAMIRDRDKLKIKAKRSKLSSDWEHYKKARNSVTSRIRHVKRQFISNKIQTAGTSTKEIWQSLKYVVPGKKTNSQITSVTVDNEAISGKNLADLFNHYFVNIGQNLDKANPNMNPRKRRNHATKVKSTFSFKPVEVEKVCDLLESLSIDRAAGPDNIPAKLLKCVAPLIAPPLTFLINLSLKNGVIPSEWKEARVTPIHKGGSKDDIGNYRPISVIPILGKIIEKVAYDQLQTYLTDNNILTNKQFGFRPKHSTQDALLNVTEKWFEFIDGGNVVGVVMIDLKKAFDTVNHKILIHKLKMCGFDDHTLKWFGDYLSNRTQSTCVNGFVSDKENIKCGVPQGSLLGPLLFSLYVNDMPSIIKHSEMSLYADDTCLFCSAKKPEDVVKRINEDLVSVSEWLMENRLFVNKKKCEFMFLGSSSRLKKIERNDKAMNVLIDNVVIQRTNTCKYLGVMIDETLQWNAHIEYIHKKVAKYVYLLKRVRDMIDQRTSLLFYKSIIQSHLDYCNVVWGNTGKRNCDKLQVLQNRSLRIVMKVNYLFPTNDLYNTLHLDRLNIRRSKQLAHSVFRAVRHLGPPCINDLFTQCDKSYNTRSGHTQLKLPKPKTNYCKRKYAHRGAKLWNKIEKPVNPSMSFDSFKSYINTLKEDILL